MTKIKCDVVRCGEYAVNCRTISDIMTDRLYYIHLCKDHCREYDIYHSELRNNTKIKMDKMLKEDHKDETARLF